MFLYEVVYSVEQHTQCNSVGTHLECSVAHGIARQMKKYSSYVTGRHQGSLKCNGPEFQGVGPCSKHSLSMSCSFPWVLNDGSGLF